MRLVELLRSRFPRGLQYEDAVHVCIALYSSGERAIGQVVDDTLSMEVIAQAFADLHKEGIVSAYQPYKAVYYGANYHNPDDKGHWIEVQASALKANRTYDGARVEALMQQTQDDGEEHSAKE